MPKLSKLKKALRSYDAMGEHLRRKIGSRSKTKILGITHPDDFLALEAEAKMMGAKRKCRGGKLKGKKVRCYRVKQ